MALFQVFHYSEGELTKIISKDVPATVEETDRRLEISWNICATTGMLQVGRCEAPGKVQAAGRIRNRYEREDGRKS